MRTVQKRTLTIALIFSATLLLTAQNNTKKLPIDPTIRYGKLSNGLTYYIKHNEEPKKRAEFHIAQNVGAILEKDHQNGLAHFLEHMAFNGTKNFPDKGIINYFETIGVKFGYDINAYTSLDETVYRLSNVPTTRTNIIDSALLVLHDWSNFISLHEAEIDKERGVILEEWRTGNNANRRMWKKSSAEKYINSQYAIRDVIGDTAIINNFSYQALRDYYKKWYRPDQQAIVIVGDIDVEHVEQQIKTIFADIQKKENYGERPLYYIPNNTTPIISIVTDKEATQTVIRLEYKKDILPANTKLSLNGYITNMIHNLIGSMLGERFGEIAKQANAPFAVAYGFYTNIVKTKDAFNLIAIPKQGQEKEGLQALLYQGEKMKRYGFTNAELQRAKLNLNSNMEKSYNEREHIDNQALAEEYIRHYLENEPIPSIETEYKIVQKILPSITIDKVNKIAQALITDNNLIVSITGAEKKEVKIPHKTTIKEQLKDIKKQSIEPPVEEDVNLILMKKPQQKGNVIHTATNKTFGTTELTLNNGIHIIVKPTNFRKDEILLYAYSQGGLSKITQIADLPSAIYATEVIKNNGIGKHDATTLKKILTGKNVSLSPYIAKYSEGMDGQSSIKDFETMLQLAHLYFTPPRKDTNAFQALQNRYKTLLANAASNPNKAFSDSIQMTTTDHDPRTILPSAQLADQIDQDKAIEIYQQRFANPADFTFVLVGNIDPNNSQTIDLLTQYLGTLKTNKTNKETYSNSYRKTPTGKIKNYFTQEMQDKKASNRIQYTTNTLPYNLQNIVTLDAIGEILQIRYMESIREEKGGSYGVGVAGRINRIPTPQAILMMQFDTDPSKQAELIQIIHHEIDDILDKGVKTTDLQKIKENMLKQYAQDLENNESWVSTLVNYYRDHIDYITDYPSTVKKLTPKEIQSKLKALKVADNIIEVVMMPK